MKCAARPRLATGLPFAAALLAVGLLATPASAGGGTPAACLSPGQVITQTVQRFSDVAPGNVVAIGNTLGLSKALDVNGPGIEDSIGTFIALDPSDVDDTPNPGWFAGTTADWTANGSSAVLDLPAEATILHAELVWGGSFADPGNTNSVEANLSDPVRLIVDGAEVDVAPAAGGITYSQGIFRYYARSADVTAFIAQQGEGEVTVAGVPGVATDAIDELHTAGWTLVVAYRDQSQPIRNLTIFFGGEFVDENTTQDYGFSGFCASPEGDLQGTAVITALEGDADRDGDVLCIAPSENPADNQFVGLSGPNNPSDNFFASQINDADGELDTQGTFGDRNHDAFAVTNTSGGRQGWDLTQLALSSADGSLSPGQTGATMRTATLDDSYLPMSAAFSIDVNAPFFAPGDQNGTSIDLSTVKVGDTFTVTVQLANTGAAPANNILFRMPLPSGLSLQGFTSDGGQGDITGDPVEPGELAGGVAEGTLAPTQQRTVTATLRVDSAPDGGGTRFFVQPTWTYDWVMCTGQAPLSEDFAGAADSVDFEGEIPAATSSATSTGAGGATTGTAAGGGDSGAGGDDGDGDGDGDGEDGAGGGAVFVASGSGICAATPGPARGSSGFVGLALAGLAVLVARRRR